MAETAENGVGHNAPVTEGPEKDIASLAIGFARRIIPVDNEIDGLRGDVRSIIGEAKSAGVKAKYVKLAQKFLKAEDENVLTEEYKVILHLMKALNIGLGHQMELFADDRPLDDRAFHQGYADGIAGKSLENPYQSGEPMNRYGEGWHKAQSEVAEAMQRRMEEQNRQREERERAKAAEKTGGGDAPSQDEVDAAQGVAAKLAGADSEVVTDLAARRKKNAAIVAAGKATEPKAEE
jgi:ribosome modulation factor/uncharacterized protein (UPF0335 family)